MEDRRRGASLDRILQSLEHSLRRAYQARTNAKKKFPLYGYDWAAALELAATSGSDKVHLGRVLVEASEAALGVAKEWTTLFDALDAATKAVDEGKTTLAPETEEILGGPARKRPRVDREIVFPPEEEIKRESE